MSLPEAFQNELLAWLDARLSERFARQQRTLLEGVVEMVAAMLTEQIKLGGEVCKLELGGLGEEFAKLQDAVDRQQSTVAQLQDLIKKLQRLDGGAHGEHSTMN
jgi:hypothetical protein